MSAPITDGFRISTYVDIWWQIIAYMSTLANPIEEHESWSCYFVDFSSESRRWHVGSWFFFSLLFFKGTVCIPHLGKIFMISAPILQRNIWFYYTTSMMLPKSLPNQYHDLQYQSNVDTWCTSKMKENLYT